MANKKVRKIYTYQMTISTEHNFGISSFLYEPQRAARTIHSKQKHIEQKKSRKPKAKQQRHDDPDKRVFLLMQQQVQNRLENCEPGKELEVLYDCLKPDLQTLWLRCMTVKNDILLALQQKYPLVRLEIFGSSVMGIAFKGG